VNKSSLKLRKKIPTIYSKICVKRWGCSNDLQVSNRFSFNCTSVMISGLTSYA